MILFNPDGCIFLYKLMFDACVCIFYALILLLESMLPYVLLAYCCVFVDCSLSHFGKTSEQRRTPTRLLAGVTVTRNSYIVLYYLLANLRASRDLGRGVL